MPTHEPAAVARSTPASDAALLVTMEKRSKILALRRRGMSYQRIADSMSVSGDKMSRSQIFGIVQAYLTNVQNDEQESADQLRLMENERLDELFMVWNKRALGDESKSIDPDPKAAAVVLRIQQRRAKLNGLDSAKRVDVTVQGSLLHQLGADPELVEAERRAFELAFQTEAPADDIDNIIEGTLVDAD